MFNLLPAKPSRRIIPLALVSTVPIIIWLGCHLWMSPHVPPPDPQLHSALPYHEVVIPFTMKDGWINVTAEVSGRPVQCIVDTGNPAYMDAPQSLHFKDPDVGATYPDYRPSPSTSPRPAKMVPLPEVRLGGYTLRNCPTIVYQPGQGDAFIKGRAVLGNSFFSDVVLTFDFQKKVILLRDTDYQLETEKFDANGQILDFDWFASDDFDIGIPTCNGTINAQPVKIGLDTGLPNVDIVANKLSLIASLTRAYKLPVHGGLFWHQRWSLGSENYTGAIGSWPEFKYGADATIGLPILKNYRITIDYPRKKILLLYRPLPKFIQIKKAAAMNVSSKLSYGSIIPVVYAFSSE